MSREWVARIMGMRLRLCGCDSLVTVFLLTFAFLGQKHASGSFGLDQHVCLG
jgi:hypothetical protein